LAHIVIPGGQEGEFNRRIDRIRLGGQYNHNGNTARIEYIADDADEAIVRTDYLDRTTLKFRAQGKLGKQVSIALRGRLVDAENDIPGIDSQIDLFHGGIDLNIEAAKDLNFVLSYGIFDFESEARATDPLRFTQFVSLHEEDGTDLGFHGYWKYKKCTVEGGYNRYENDGLLMQTNERIRLSIGYAFTDSLQGIIQGASYEYTEDLLPIADYEADLAAILIRWVQ
jgi:hypothetical protein